LSVGPPDHAHPPVLEPELDPELELVDPELDVEPELEVAPLLLPLLVLPDPLLLPLDPLLLVPPLLAEPLEEPPAPSSPGVVLSPTAPSAPSPASVPPSAPAPFNGLAEAPPHATRTERARKVWNFPSIVIPCLPVRDPRYRLVACRALRGSSQSAASAAQT
jgi:hypothetical protein